MFRSALSRIALLFVLPVPAALAQAAPPGCEAIAPLFPDASCVANAYGVAVAPSATDASTLLAAAEPGRIEFERAFALSAARYAIILAGADGIAATTEAAVQKAGFGATLVWLSPEAKIAQAEASVRRIVDERLKAAGMGDQEREVAVASAVAQARQQLASRNSAIDTTAVPHELGHKWFARAFWPKAPEIVEDQYGGPGPDWLDELAAVILEPAESKASRRAEYWRRYTAAKTNAADSGPGAFLDIQSFLTARHPMTAVAAEIGRSHAAAGTTGFRIITGTEATATAADSVSFYLKSLMLSDYLVDRSSNPAIVGVIARALASGRSFEAWLAHDGAAHGLPQSQSALAADVLQWLARNAPQAVTSP
jgi:hypothetical protein